MWKFHQPTEIHFGVGVRARLPELALRYGSRICAAVDPSMVGNAHVDALLQALGASMTIFTDITPNPDVRTVDRLAGVIVETASDAVVAIGGGSTLDCAKVACTIACQPQGCRYYHSGGGVVSEQHVPLLAVPTTAGTGSEVTPIAVLSDEEQGIKAPIAHPNFFPSVAIVDPELTLSMPPAVTAATGLDALAHAIEAFWSKHHQPLSDQLACAAVSLVVEHFSAALADGQQITARSGMAQAALFAGMAFHHTKNAAVHACSYPLTQYLGLSHGIACAVTLDHFIRFNAPALAERGRMLADAAGVASLTELADLVARFKEEAGIPAMLHGIHLSSQEWVALVAGCFNPLMDNNPRDVSANTLDELLRNSLGLYPQAVMGATEHA
jgi:alcohol dehydrogenase